MHLKSLTMLGFKSFADKTALTFGPGITAIVGPNGCGKSNVADAVRWVLGEQSVKALRGGEMADVIFNGTDRRKALGLAEVSLTVGGVDADHLKAAGVELLYDEVTLTRRIFRDGGSEYFINRVPCRLKDIQQLFMGTGVGRTSYSIMAQGNITQILSSKPEDRRLVFEEAAGITRFKTQKRESLRKLEATEQNLLRVADLIREVKRQIGSLQRQAGKARRYKQYLLELQHLDTQLARHHFDLLHAEIREREAQIEDTRREIEQCTAQVLDTENRLAGLRQAQTDLEHQISLARQQGLELKNEADKHEGRIAFNEERLRELQTQHAQALSDIAQAEERRLIAEQELAGVRARLQQSAARLGELRTHLDQRRADVQQGDEALRGRQEAVRTLQTEGFSLAQQVTRARNEITALDLQKQGHRVRLEKLSVEKVQLEEERTRLEARLREFTLNVEAEKAEVQNRRLSIEERQQRIRQLQQDLAATTQELDGILRQQAEKRSRLNVLEQLDASHEGFDAGAQAALKTTQDVVGTLADRIRVPAEYVTAVEAALGHHLQILLTEQPEPARAILTTLAQQRKGRASLAPLAFVEAVGRLKHAGHGHGHGNGHGNSHGEHAFAAALAASQTAGEVSDASTFALALADGGAEYLASEGLNHPSEADAEGAASTHDGHSHGNGHGNGQGNGHGNGHHHGDQPGQDPVPSSTDTAWPGPLPGPLAIDVIEAEDSVRPLLQGLLGRTVIVSDLQAASTAWPAARGHLEFVTPAGELLSRMGVFTGGATPGAGKTPSSILGRKNEIADLELHLRDLQDQAQDASRRKGAVQADLTAAQAGWQQAQTELRNQEVAIATRQGEFNALQNSQRLLHQKIDTVVYEIQTLAAQAQEGEQKRAELGAAAAALGAREDEMQQRLAALNAEVETLRTRREQAVGALTEAKVAVATEEQVLAAQRQQQPALEQRLAELRQLADRRRQETGAYEQRRLQAETEMDESRRRIGVLQLERDQVQQQIAGLETQRDALQAEVGTHEQALREQRRALTAHQEHRGALEVELAQKAMAVQNLRERIQTKYQLLLDDIRSECITITFAEEGPPRVHVVSPEELEAGGVATDWAAVADQVAALQKRIDEMGPVNLVAIEEYEETEQRYQFLSKQHDDLVQAKTQLLEVIHRINTQTRDMFAATFSQIRENFRALFTEVFGGGAADLQLVDEGDVLESGIEIMARPPGKQLKSISLLSGGEQTMTAVALLFAIYQVKPSPFCVLDELDAPLDESNINRFIRVLQRFLVHSQFIIITHNKRTIGMAGVLYGVTMQEQGVSRIVSVKFHKTDDASPATAARPLVDVSGRDVEEEENAPRPRGQTLELVGAN